MQKAGCLAYTPQLSMALFTARICTKLGMFKECRMHTSYADVTQTGPEVLKIEAEDYLHP
jgi:hypothetical protein